MAAHTCWKTHVAQINTALIPVLHCMTHPAQPTRDKSFALLLSGYKGDFTNSTDALVNIFEEGPSFATQLKTGMSLQGKALN